MSRAADKLKGYGADVSFGKAYDARLLARLWPFARPYKASLLLALLSYPLAAALHLVQPYLIKVAIDEHLLPKREEGFATLVLLFVAATVLEFGVRFYQVYVTQMLGQWITRDLRSALFARLQVVDLAFIEKNPIGRLMTRVTNDVENIGEMFAAGGVSILGDVVTLTGIVVMMTLLDAELTLYAMSTLPVLLLIVLGFRGPARAAFRDIRAELARLNGFLNEALGGMALIQVFRQEAAERAVFTEVNRAYRDANLRAIRYDAASYAMIEAIGTFATAAVLLFGVSRLSGGEASIGVLVAFVDYLRRFFGPITELSAKYTLIQSAMASAERAVALLDEAPRIVSPAAPAEVHGPRGALAFERVSFEYRAGEPVLVGIDLEIAPGEKVAVVGPTGSGKSTLVKLIARFYDPTSGVIRLGGTPLPDLSLADLRGRLSVVLQDPYLFDATIAENITLGRALPPEVLADALARSHADRVIARRPRGLEETVGERGHRLSAGERQLVAFARALAHDPDVLILDEATSAVDAETEALVQDGLKAVVAGRTAVIIAHRLSTIRSVDRIVVLAHGRIVESGTHEALYAQGGLYRSLYELQFAGTAEPEPSFSPNASGADRP